MKVLVIGGGGREHALVWKIAQSPMVSEIYCAPGNAGIAEYAELVSIQSDDLKGLLNFALAKKIDLTIVGPEKPLAMGIVNLFQENGLAIFGPDEWAAWLEKDKIWAKKFLIAHKIPTVEKFAIFNQRRDSLEKCHRYASENLPCAIKVQGLAGGKGVEVCYDEDKAAQMLMRIFNGEFGEAGQRFIIERAIEGQEVSIQVITDGQLVVPLLPAQDHKRLEVGDQGLNTGGMGAYAPVPFIGTRLKQRIMREIIFPTINGLRRAGIIYRGCLYAGLMITPDGPKVLEFNCRFGDPELQPLVMLMKSDLLPILETCARGRSLVNTEIEWKKGAAVCVVMVSDGYPVFYERGEEIKGLKKVALMKNVSVFHAGTKENKRGKIVTNGGRVLGVTGYGTNIRRAIKKACQATKKIYWPGVFYRDDVGRKAL
ncbi:MAG: phosphoribosylamine--glycine ligase [Candidatus Portnoybacteria bacterium]|nr:phosphoribosylamine--glycine ligase [Candidatus Portnoybacteria bacterium]